MDVLYDAIVIGAGVEGSSTAYNIANNDRTKEVALLEQVYYDFVSITYDSIATLSFNWVTIAGALMAGLG